MSKTFSGKQVIRVLVHDFGFSVVGQKGSHVKLKKRIANGTRTTIVPLHKELATGTLRGALALAGVDMTDFLKRVT